MTDRTIPVLPPLPGDAAKTSETVPAPRPRARPRRQRPDEERRLWSAGHALVVSVLAIGISLLLNAPGVHKNTYNQEAGWEREVALAFTGPLAALSDAVLLDRPRESVQALIGRSGEDEIDTSVAIGDETPPTGAPAPVNQKPARVSFSPKNKLGVWVVGDSLVVTPGFSITDAAASSPVMKGLGVDGRIATGLTRPDVFNWFTHLRSKLKALKPDVVVLSFGANDDKAYMTGLPEGVSIGSFGDAAWQREYRRRVGGVFDLVNRSGAHAIWIGLPQTSSANVTRRFDVLNTAVHAEARERPGRVTYLDTYTLFAGPDGGYAEYLAKPSGGSVKVRGDDGVHFEASGGDMIAREVMKILGERFDLTSWKKRAKDANG